MKITNKTPKSWSEISFRTYLQTLELPDMIEGLSNEEQEVFNLNRSVQLLSILTGYSIEEINNAKPNEVIQAMSYLSFMGSEIPKVKVNHKTKQPKEITYQIMLDYINLSKSKDSHRNLPKIVSLFFVDLTEEEAKQMPADYVFSCFFLLLKKAKKYWRISVFKTAKELLIHLIKETIGKLKLKVKRN